MSPLPSEALLGQTEIVLEAAAPEGARVLKIELYVDDKLIGTLLEAPWRFSWDAGDALRARNLRARVYASDGSTASDRITTRAITGVQRTAVTLVQVPCTVRTAQGKYVLDLRRDEFTLLESGRLQELAVFSAERKPAHIALLFDASASMMQEDRLTIAQEAATGFIDALEPGDTAMLIAFSDAPRLVVPATSDKAALKAGLASLQAKGGTALYDAMVSAIDVLKAREERKAVVLLSDGRDEAVDGLGPGSLRTYEETLDAILAAQVSVYVVGTGERLADEFDVLRRRTLGEILGSFADRSGGRSYFVKKASKLKDAYRSIADELRHQYTLGYYPSSDAPDDPAAVKKGHGPGWRSIEVRVSRPRARVTARSGYYGR
ncbi:MAG: VWA domain-containing protein [Candidatus Polarisedimenticolia bacterium]